MVTRTALALAGCWFAVGCRFDPVGTARSALRDRTEHVLLLSIDGFHDFDLTHYVAAHPTSALASLVARGTTYTQAYAPAPSDSFPATLAIATGGSPVSTGVYYDTTWDDRLSPAGSDCTTRGAVVSYKETINLSTNAGSTAADIDPAKLPRDPDAGCAPVYPHQYLHVNTIQAATFVLGKIGG